MYCPLKYTTERCPVRDALRPVILKQVGSQDVWSQDVAHDGGCILFSLQPQCQPPFSPASAQISSFLPRSLEP